MGLELYKAGPSDLSLTADDGPDLRGFPGRHFPGRQPSDSRTKNSGHPSREKLFKWGYRAAIADATADDGRPSLSEWKLRELEHAYRGRSSVGGPSPAEVTTARLRVHGRLRRGHASDVHEGLALARSSSFQVPLASQGRRPPSLERQEAFRDSSTCKRRRSLDDNNHHGGDGGYFFPTASSSSLSGSGSGFSDETEAAAAAAAAETAELYRIGLLYDDEHLRGSGFGFDVVDHPEPAYTLRVAPPSALQNRRNRKRKSNLGQDERSGAPSPDSVPTSAFDPLPLELSFRALGDDDAIAAFLISPDKEEFDAAVASGVSVHGDDDEEEVGDEKDQDSSSSSGAAPDVSEDKDEEEVDEEEDQDASRSDECSINIRSTSVPTLAHATSPYAAYTPTFTHYPSVHQIAYAHDNDNNDNLTNHNTTITTPSTAVPAATAFPDLIEDNSSSSSASSNATDEDHSQCGHQVEEVVVDWMSDDDDEEQHHDGGDGLEEEEDVDDGGNALLTPGWIMVD